MILDTVGSPKVHLGLFFIMIPLTLVRLIFIAVDGTHRFLKFFRNLWGVSGLYGTPKVFWVFRFLKKKLIEVIVIWMLIWLVKGILKKIFSRNFPEFSWQVFVKENLEKIFVKKILINILSREILKKLSISCQENSWKNFQNLVKKKSKKKGYPFG